MMKSHNSSLLECDAFPWNTKYPDGDQIDCEHCGWKSNRKKKNYEVELNIVNRTWSDTGVH